MKKNILKTIVTFIFIIATMVSFNTEANAKKVPVVDGEGGGIFGNKVDCYSAHKEDPRSCFYHCNGCEWSAGVGNGGGSTCRYKDK